MSEDQTKYLIHHYPEQEEKLNVITHFVGLVLSVLGFFLLMAKAVKLDDFWAVISFPVFGLSMIALYLASTLYHQSTTPKIRYHLNILDHASIYVLIAGSYTPFVLVTLNGTEGWIIFSVVWSIALIGIVFKIFFTGRFNILSTILYLAMGWLIVFSFRSLVQNLEFSGLVWLISGGIAYTLGAVLYAFEKLKFNHAIFHVFVLVGTLCHFMSVYFYVVPVVN